MRTIGFFSYTSFDDDANDGLLSKIRERLEAEVRAEYGHPIEIFQDRDDIKIGDEWRERLRRALADANYLIPILTPNFFTSGLCREELGFFIAKAAELKRPDLVLPVLWRGVPQLGDAAARAGDLLLEFIERRQYRDWTAHKVKRGLYQCSLIRTDAPNRECRSSGFARVER